MNTARSRPFTLLLIWILALGSVVIFMARRSASPKPLPRFWPAPSFHAAGVTAAGAAPLRNADLLGKPWIADFIYTRCGGPCPILSGKMEALQRILPQDVRLVSFSVDPEEDTPAVLQDYARRFHADPARWVFARLDKKDLFPFIVQGFRLGLSEERAAPAGFRILHSTQFVLVDPQGMIRGFYNANGNVFMETLRKDTERVLKDPA